MSFSNILLNQPNLVKNFDSVDDKKIMLPYTSQHGTTKVLSSHISQHGTTKVLSSHQNEASFARFSDRVAVIDKF